MSGDADAARVWLEGDVLVAAVGVTAPTDTTTDWLSVDADWEPLGLLSEDGLTEGRDADSNDMRAWGGILVRTVRSNEKRTFKVAVLENSDVVFHLLNPGSSSETIGGITTRDIKASVPDPRAFGFEKRDGYITSRIVVPRGEVTEVGEAVANEQGIESREITVTVYPDPDTSILFTEVTDDPAAAVAGS